MSLFFRLVCLFFLAMTSYATPSVNLELHETSLSDTLRLLAKFLHKNVIVSQSVKGVANLQMQKAEPLAVFNLLLTLNGLGKFEVGDVWVIAPQAELIKRKQDDLKWQEIAEDSAPLTMAVWQLNYAKVGEIAKLFLPDRGSFLSKRGRVEIDERTNLFYIYDTSERIKRAKRWINKLDVPIKQILIEARLASVDYDAERELGIDFEVKSSPKTEEPLHKMIGGAVGHYSLSVIKLADGSLLDVKLAALEKRGRAELISSPSLFTANQQMASIEAGEEVPYQEVSESGGTAVAFKKAVLGLHVTPQILPGNNVLLQLKINQDRPSKKMVQGVPTISTRQMMTNVLVKNGETVVLGGIFEKTEERGEEGVPFLNKIPVLGWLFQQQQVRKNKRELLIFVTPRIIAK